MARREDVHHGEAVQVDPMKPTLTAPGITLLKLKHGRPPSKFAFKISLRRYTMEMEDRVKDLQTSLQAATVGTHGYCSPRHHTQLEPYFFESTGIMFATSFNVF